MKSYRKVLTAALALFALVSLYSCGDGRDGEDVIDGDENEENVTDDGIVDNDDGLIESDDVMDGIVVNEDDDGKYIPPNNITDDSPDSADIIG